MSTEIQWGVRRGEKVERIDPASANEGYMSAEEYARVRAAASDGIVVKRRSKVVMTDWHEA